MIRRKIFLQILAAGIILLAACATPSMLVTREQSLGDRYFNAHEYEEAARHYEMMLESSRKLGIYRNLSMESAVNRKIANCHEMNGNYGNALLHVREAMRLDSADNNLRGRIEDYRHEGKILIYMGSYQKGIRAVEKSLELSEGMEQSLKNVNRLVIADNNLVLGQLYSVMGKMDKALEHTGKALSIFRQAGDREGEMEALLSLGAIYTDLGDLVAARIFTDQSARLAESLKMGNSRQNQLLSSISLSLGRYEDALRYQEDALREASKYRITGQIIWSNIGLGDIYRELGDAGKAEKYYSAARAIKDTANFSAENLQASLDLRSGNINRASEYFLGEGSQSGAAVSLLRLSEMLMRSNKTDSALVTLSQAGEIFRKSGNLRGIANVQLLKGTILTERKDNSGALPLLDSAARAADYPETVWQALYQKGLLLENLGEKRNAIDSYRKSVSVIEKIRGGLVTDEFRSIYFDSKRQVYDRLINLLIEADSAVEALQVSERARARAFYDILSVRKINFRGSEGGDLIAMEQEKRLEIQKLYKLLRHDENGDNNYPEHTSADVKQIRSALTEVIREYDEIVKKLKINNPSYADIVSAEPVKLTDIQSRLDTETAVLEYWVSDSELTVWMISHTEAGSYRSLIADKELNSAVERARSAIESNDDEKSEKELKALYNYLIAPVEGKLASFSKLIIIPNQSLHFIPFQALLNSKGRFLVEDFSISYAPSASVFIICSDRMVKSGSRFMGMALSDVEVGSNPGLPGTEDELKKILPLFPDNVSAFGTHCTESFAKQNAGGCNYLHFATHGSYNYRQPLYSYLLFPPEEGNDGHLNVFEVFEMDLNCRLVTLSACETGLGNISRGDELTGLSRAFLFAGSSSVVVSLWSVADYPTALLMLNFYTYLKDHTMQDALTLAQRDVLKEYPQPVYWAPFVLIGNGNLSSQ